jgi:hypothetical protein
MRIVGRCKSFARIFAVTDSSRSRSVDETCPLTRSSSPSRISSASAPLVEPLDLRLDQALGPGGLGAADGDGLRDDGLEVVDVGEVAAVELPDRRVDVARHGQVEKICWTFGITGRSGAPKSRPAPGKGTAPSTAN